MNPSGCATFEIVVALGIALVGLFVVIVALGLLVYQVRRWPSS